MADLKKLEQAARLIIEGIGEDIKREGLIDTPKRFARFIAERCEFSGKSNAEIAKLYNKTFSCTSSSLVIEKDIPIFSFCEHHIALMYNMKVSVGYLPNGKVIGLSKIARVAEAVSKKLQLQEKIGEDIKEIVEMICGTRNVIVYIEGEHSCMTARGVKKDSKTRTVAADGVFCELSMQNNFLQMMGR